MINLKTASTHKKSYSLMNFTLITAISLAAVLGLSGCAKSAAVSPTTVAATAVTAAATVQSETTIAEQTTASTAPAEKTFTLDELAKFDGLNSNPSYVAYDGVVYDVSAFSEWRDGKHYKGTKAGTDLTAQFKQAPHGTNVLDQAVRMGVLAA